MFFKFANHVRFLPSALAFSFGIWASEIAAQGFNPNFQTRVDPFLPPPPEIVVEPKSERVLVKPAEDVEETLSLEERKKIAAEMNIPPAPAGFTALALGEYYDSKGIARTRIVRKKAQYKDVKQARKTIISFSANSGYSYESNANTSNIDPISDDILSLNAALTVAVPVGPDLDTLTAFLAPISTRYDQLETNSFDALTGGLLFVKVLGQSFGEARSGIRGPATQHELVLSFDAQSFFEPGFGSEEVAFYIPGITFKRNNIGLGERLCPVGNSNNYCHYADIAIRADNTWSDIGTQENASTTLTTTLGWRTPVEGLTLSAEGSIRGRYYTEFPDGRQDLIYGLKGYLAWQAGRNVTLDASVGYTWQTSSISALDWDGLTVLPRVGLNVELR